VIHFTYSDSVVVGTYPRDDVSWAKDGFPREGTVWVEGDGSGAIMDGTYSPQNPPTTTGTMTMTGPDVTQVDQPIGSHFTVRVQGAYNGQTFSGTASFRTTDNENDVTPCVVGPGATELPHKFGHAHRYTGYSFGVLVMGAVLETHSPDLAIRWEGTDATSHHESQ